MFETKLNDECKVIKNLLVNQWNMLSATTFPSNQLRWQIGVTWSRRRGDGIKINERQYFVL